MSDRIELIDRIIAKKRKIFELENRYGDYTSADDETSATVQQYKTELVLLESQLAAIAPEEEVIPESNPIQWLGSDTDLADLFLTLRRKHYISSSSQYKMLQQLVRHFINREGKILNADSLRKEADARKNSGNEPFADIPENDKSKQTK